MVVHDIDGLVYTFKSGFTRADVFGYFSECHDKKSRDFDRIWLLTATIPPMRHSILLSAPALLLALVGCTPQGEVVSQTTCQAATARATYTWRVEYYTSRTAGGANSRRWEEFESAQLINRNRDKPAAAVTGPDDNGVWWPKIPPRPSPDEMDKRRQVGEMKDAPELLKTVDYRLECADGSLKTDAETYRKASNAFQKGQTIAATYTLGQILKANLPE